MIYFELFVRTTSADILVVLKFDFPNSEYCVQILGGNIQSQKTNYLEGDIQIFTILIR